jgi:L-aminopeptidase/D-esterase-like protein
LRRLAKRPALAIGRLGGVGAAASGDIFIAISTANVDLNESPGPISAPFAVAMHPNLALTALFEATIDATEEAILNGLVAADAIEGINRLHVPRLPHSRVQDVLRRHHLLQNTTRV